MESSDYSSALSTTFTLGADDYYIVFSFQTGNIVVKTTLDGYPWSGNINYSIQGPSAATGSSVPQSYKKLQPGSYTVKYISGGPPQARYTGITPSDTLNVRGGDWSYFTINFKSFNKVNIEATLDGKPWSGSISYSILEPVPVNEGDILRVYTEWPYASVGSSVPMSYSPVPPGNYVLSYLSGGPPDAKLIDITPASTQTVTDEGDTTYIMNFESFGSLNSLNVRATLDGQPWEGAVNYTLNGPSSLSGAKVSQSFYDVAPGRYSLSYISGGPANAVFTGVAPAELDIASDGTADFVLEFGSVGSITVKGFIHSAPWSGKCRYTVSGPVELTGTSVPQTFENVPLGEYTITYLSGGPDGREFYLVTPETQQLAAGGETAVFSIKWVIPPGEVVTVLPTTADLSLTLASDDPTPSGAGYFNYIVTVYNSAGSLTATNVEVTFLPAIVSYTSDTPSQGSYNNGTGVWTVGNIAPGGNATLQVYVGTGAGPGTVITNTAEITASDQPDPDSVTGNANPAEDDQASVTVTAD